MNDERTELLTHLQGKYEAWFKRGYQWRRTHYRMSVVAVISASLAGALPSDSSGILLYGVALLPAAKSTAGIVAAVVTALLTALAPAKKATVYLHAWGRLSRAVTRARAEPATPLRELLDAEIDADKSIEEILAS